jgi:DNA-binding NarL/FixJ family response regulator
VFRLAVTGIPNKQIAEKLRIVENTVKIHRSRVMRKLKAESLVELAHLAQLAGVCKV